MFTLTIPLLPHSWLIWTSATWFLGEASPFLLRDLYNKCCRVYLCACSFPLLFLLTKKSLAVQIQLDPAAVLRFSFIQSCPPESVQSVGVFVCWLVIQPLSRRWASTFKTTWSHFQSLAPSAWYVAGTQTVAGQKDKNNSRTHPQTHAGACIDAHVLRQLRGWTCLSVIQELYDLTKLRTEQPFL